MWIVTVAVLMLLLYALDDSRQRARRRSIEQAWLRVAAETAVFWRTRLAVDEAKDAGDAEGAEALLERCQGTLLHCRQLTSALRGWTPASGLQLLQGMDDPELELSNMITALSTDRLHDQQREHARKRCQLSRVYRQLEPLRAPPLNWDRIRYGAGIGAAFGLALGFSYFMFYHLDTRGIWVAPLLHSAGSSTVLGALAGALWSARTVQRLETRMGGPA